jgi:hypothetical protein
MEDSHRLSKNEKRMFTYEKSIIFFVNIFMVITCFSIAEASVVTSVDKKPKILVYSLILYLY